MNIAALSLRAVEKSAQWPYAGSPDMREWAKQACPWGETRHRAWIMSSPTVAGEGYSYARSSIESFGNRDWAQSPHSVHNTTIMFVGDSTMRQFTEAFACRFRSSLQSDESRWSEWPKFVGKVPSPKGIDAAYGQRHIYMQSSTIRFYGGLVIAYHDLGDCGIENFNYTKHGADPHGQKHIYVFSMGHHTSCSDEDLANFTLPSDLVETTHVIWREYSPQSFATHHGNYEAYLRFHKKGTHCESLVGEPPSRQRVMEQSPAFAATMRRMECTS